MINCVPVGEQLHLYLYGDLICFNWRQKSILFALLPIVVLFPFSFGISLDMLKKRSISSTTFLFSMVMPYLAIILYAKQKIVGLTRCSSSGEEKRCIEEILQLEEELFKEEDRAIRWPIIQLYRNLIVAMLNTFVLNPIYRSLVLFPVFLIFTAHDARRMTYKHIYLDYFQMLTSACLLIINACNALPLMSIVFDVMVMSSMGDILRAVRYLELLLLTIVPLSLPAWKLWEKMNEISEDSRLNNWKYLKTLWMEHYLKCLRVFENFVEETLWMVTNQTHKRNPDSIACNNGRHI